ncbi:TonB family protein [Jannaschia aquimarina]|uniref:Gram-negative bacterial tonB protein n=1 Tax=Jannaschia aquimarina TaxID=935700 RepID=A0A0D1DC19_9RHOB|nr:TonB family protein [Jannaschia aquimarina]KIT17563.1 Gram-negative bacterial tonB protein [Jannaschia aquimarina]SNS72770.1 outer membrane transport energization protein TonB [Jannaschia aquimarina]
MKVSVPGSTAVAGGALVASLGVHLLVAGLGPVPAPIEVAGGGGAEVAVDGVAFEDLVRGVTEAVAPEAAEQPLPPEIAMPVEAMFRTLRPEPARRMTLPEARGATAPLAAVQPDGLRAPVAEAPPPAAAQSGIVPVPAAQRVVSASPPDTALSAASPTTRVLPATTAPDAETLTPELDDSTPLRSVRPTTRPRAIEDRATDLAQHRAAQDGRQRAAATRDPGRRREPAAQAGPQGNTNERTADRGATGGRDGKDASSGAGRAQAAGNAAASNYPGQVQRRIARQRMPRSVGAGSARVSFTISGNGALASIGLAASSGNARLDQAAVRIVRGAAPFPPPPPGARRQFVIPISGR